MSDMLDWAKREVEIACKKENPNRKEGEFDYDDKEKCVEEE